MGTVASIKLFKNTTLKKRSSNFELLRIISMLFIIAGHFVGQSGMSECYNGFNFCTFAVLFFESGARAGTLLFLFLGCWFMVDSSFRASKIIKLYSQLWFYAVIITFILVLVGIDVSLRWKIGSFIPYTSNTHWFIRQYLNLMILAPFLKGCFEWDRTKLKKLLIILFVLICVVSSIAKFQNTFIGDLIFFIFTFLFIGYYKKFVIEPKWLKRSYLLLGVGIYLCMVGIKMFCRLYESGVFHLGELVITQYISDFKCLPTFILCFCIFAFFKNLDLKHKNWINLSARSALAVYIIHQHPVFYMYLWKDIIRCDSWMGGPYGIVILVVLIPVIYIVCSFIDVIRLKIVEPLWVSSKLYNIVEIKINQFYKGVV